MDGLIVRSPWSELIVEGVKTMEVRGVRTQKAKERIAIIESGMNQIIGEVDIVECVELDKEAYEEAGMKHCIPWTYEEVLTMFGYKKLYGWKLENAVHYSVLKVCHNRKRGQVIWVKDVEGEAPKCM